MRETVRELGEFRATGFLKKFYGWYLGRGRFPRPFKQELVMLPTLAEVETRLLAAAPGAAEVLERLEAELGDGRRGAARLAADLDLRRRLGSARACARRAPGAADAASCCSGRRVLRSRPTTPTVALTDPNGRCGIVGRQIVGAHLRREHLAW